MEVNDLTRQRDAALVYANHIRTSRARLKDGIRDGSRDPLEVLAEVPDYAEGMPLEKFLLAIPMVGAYKAGKILHACRISPSVTLGKLTERQRTVLAHTIREATWR